MDQELEEKIVQAFVRTWAAIAEDVLDVMPDKTASREDAFEIAADSLFMYGKVNGVELNIFFHADEETKQRIMKKAFKHELYCY